MYLEEAEDSDHCLQVLEGSHHFFQEFFESMVPHNSERIEHRPLNEQEKDSDDYLIEMYEDISCNGACLTVANYNELVPE